MKASLILAILFLVACGDVEHAVDGSVDVNANFERAEIKMVSGILYVRTTDSVDGFCLAVDSSTDYGEVWLELPDANQKRTVPYTTEETTNCGG